MADPYVGEIRMFAGTFAPVDWQFCDGSLLDISTYDTLYSLVGTTYGGDGVNTFGIPDLRGRLPLHFGTNPSTNTPYALGQSSGSENVTLQGNQVPVHNHALLASPTTGSQNAPPNNTLGAIPSGSLYVLAAPTAAMSGQSIGSTGGNQPHPNVMPFLVINFIIALNGVYPPRN